MDQESGETQASGEPGRRSSRSKLSSWRQALAGLVVATPLVVVTSCIGYTPLPLEPANELNLLDLRSSADVKVEAKAPGDAAWFPLQADVTLGDGLKLAEANALALCYAGDVIAARTAHRVAGAQLLQAGLLANPELFVGPRVSTRDGEWIVPAGLSWRLPIWGRRDAERDLGAARLSVDQIAVQGTELRVLGEVRERYIKMARLVRESTAHDELQAASARVLAWVESLHRAGQVDAVTLFLARLEHDEADSMAIETRAAVANATRELLESVGLPPAPAIGIALDPDPALLPAAEPSSREALLRHPNLQLAQAEYQASEAALRLEVARQYPDIRFGPEFESDRGDPTLGFGLGITLPVFDRNRGGIAAAEARREGARERFRNDLLALMHAEAAARADAETTGRILDSFRAGALRQVLEARNALEQRTRLGAANVLEVLSVQRALVRARVRELELEERVATARLRAAIAGGQALSAAQSGASREEDK